VHQVNIGLRVLTRPDPVRLPALYRELGTDYAERVLPSIIQVRSRTTQRTTARRSCCSLLAYMHACASRACEPAACTHTHALHGTHGACTHGSAWLAAWPSAAPLHGTNTATPSHPVLLQETLKSVVAQYNASQLLTMREVVSNDIRRILTERARFFNIILDDVSITQLTFSKVYEAAIEAKQVAQQEASRAKFIVGAARTHAHARTRVHTIRDTQTRVHAASAACGWRCGCKHMPGYTRTREAADARLQPRMQPRVPLARRTLASESTACHHVHAHAHAPPPHTHTHTHTHTHRWTRRSRRS
jgi:hypothetical protein